MRAGVTPTLNLKKACTFLVKNTINSTAWVDPIDRLAACAGFFPAQDPGQGNGNFRSGSDNDARWCAPTAPGYRRDRLIFVSPPRQTEYG